MPIAVTRRLGVIGAMMMRVKLFNFYCVIGGKNSASLKPYHDEDTI